MSHDVYVRQTSFVLAGLAVLTLVAACPGGEVSPLPDAAVPLSGPEPRPVIVGAFADCTPAGFSDVACDKGLHCAVVRVGDPPADGYLTKCVPNSPKPLLLNDVCQFDQPGPTPNALQYDSCDVGLGCVNGLCRKLCQRSYRGDCGDELCVLPSQVTGTGYCAPSDGCQAVFPQTGCGVDPQGGGVLGCYVLTDDKGGGTFCMKQDAYGNSTGALGAVCDHSSNCQPGFGCTNIGYGDPICRPYCALPETPDGGMAPKVKCAADLGTCNPIANIDLYGRCY